jgi:hypothetical protein
MLVIRQKGYHDLEPVLLCGVCKKPLLLRDAWLAFAALGGGVTESAGVWCHRECPRGEAQRLFQRPRMLLWRAGDVFSRLLQHADG